LGSAVEYHFMLGKREAQGGLFDVGNVFDLSLDPKTFYGQLAGVSDRLFRDDEFAEMYSSRMGRPSAPPSDLALVLLMQFYARVSDAEAIARAMYDARWLCVLRRRLGEQLCAKSTYCVFRAQLILHDKLSMVFERSIRAARQAGILPSDLCVAIDTKPILGRGAVEDTYNLLASGIRQLASALALAEKISRRAFFSREGLDRYDAQSIKGAETMDWSCQSERNEFLSGIVADAVKLLGMAGPYVNDQRVKDAASLLEQLLLQDVDVVEGPDGDGAVIKQGTEHGRVPSVTDPEQRHGRKSASKRFTGAKASVVTDTKSGIILAADVIAGDAKDSTGALGLVEQAEKNAQTPVADTLGDCAYGSGETRQAFADAGRELNVRVPEPVRQDGHFTKKDFTIDLTAGTVTCPNGATTRQARTEADGGRVFSFGVACSDCPLRSKCTSAADGRTIHVHAQEALLQEALAKQKEPAWRRRMRERLAVENSLARLAYYGIGQARYLGHEKTRFQLTISATVANLRRVWNYAMAQERLGASATVA
jgi:hypothetical protein